MKIDIIQIKGYVVSCRIDGMFPVKVAGRPSEIAVVFIIGNKVFNGLFCLII